MTMNGVSIVAVWVLCATIPLSNAPASQTDSAQTGLAARVKLEISGLPQVKQAISEIMTPKLKAIPGVQLVDSNPQWTIRIETVVVPDGENKNVAGIGLSEVILEHRPYVQMLQILGKAWDYLLAAGVLRQDQPLDEGMKQVVKMIKGIPQTEDSSKLMAHRMGIFHVNNLQKACGDLVTDFNLTILRPSLKASQASAAAATDRPAVAAVPAGN
jgi:hypothetical protein